jgi:hypothetical protein
MIVRGGSAFRVGWYGGVMFVRVGRVQILVNAGMLLAVMLAPACSSADDVQLATDRCVDTQTVYSPPATLGGAGSVQTLRRTGRCPPDADRQQAEEAVWSSIGSGSRAERMIEFARSSPPIAVDLILGDATEPTVRLQIPPGYIEPRIPGLLEGVVDGEYTARSIYLFFVRQGDQFRPWIDAMGQYVDSEVRISLNAVPDDHLDAMRSVYDDSYSGDSRYYRTGDAQYGLDAIEFTDRDRARIATYLPSSSAENWFWIECSPIDRSLSSDLSSPSTCRGYFFITHSVLMTAAFPFEKLSEWRLYLEAYNRIYFETGGELE